MDVLKPNVICISGRCYRLYGQTVGSANFDSEYTGYGDDEQTYTERCWDDDCPADYEIEEADTGRLKTCFHIPRSLHGVLIGLKGATKLRIEKETKTLIRIPKKGLDQDIVVSGTTRDSVAQARHRMELIALAARQKQQFTHFLSVPVNSDGIKRGFLKFQEQVLTECKGRGIGKDIFQDPNKLHITVGTLVLLDEDDRKKAALALQSCHQEVLQPLLQNGPVKLSICGIEYMNDDPAEVDVLYGKVKDLSGSLVLQELADNLIRHFSKTGLMPKQFDSVKLHVTIMNSLFRRGDGNSQTGENQRKVRETFDASSILKKFQDFNFGEMILKNIDLSRRYSTASNGYYEATSSIVLN